MVLGVQPQTDRDSTSQQAGTPSRYRHSEVGVIPADWAVGSLRAALLSTPNYGINAAAVGYDENLPAYIRITDIDEEGRFRPSPRVSVAHPEASRFFLGQDDLVFARTGASVGKSYLYDERDGPLVYAGFLIRVTPDPRQLLPDFLAYYAQSRRYWDWVASSSVRSGQPGINAQQYGKLQLPLPSLAEQRAIAEALSDVDELLAALDALIAKKQAIKRAAMQQLLTGRTRLPGFSGEWEILPARDIGSFKGGTGFPLTAQGEMAGHYPFFKVSDMNNDGNETVMTTANHYISEQMRKSLGATAFPAGSIVFAKVGAAVFLERKKILGQASCIDNNMAAFVLDKSRLDVGFAHALLLSKKLGDLVATTALPALNAKQLGEMSLPIPLLAEQHAIATVLSDMDAEIAALEARRDKTRAIKLGMMQQLLTGRIRLIEPAKTVEASA